MIKQRGTLIVGVKADYPPFGFRSPSGEIEGIEPTLAADVAKSLGVKLELVPVAASNRVEYLEQGKVDLIIATMNGTMMRRMAVDIVKPHYYAAGYNIMVPKAMNLKSWAELKGKRGMRHRGCILQLCSDDELRASGHSLHRHCRSPDRVEAGTLCGAAV